MARTRNGNKRRKLILEKDTDDEEIIQVAKTGWGDTDDEEIIQVAKTGWGDTDDEEIIQVAKTGWGDTDDEEIIQIAKTGWGDLPYDLLKQILRLLSVEDLMRSISLVCRYWKLACRTVLFWKDYETLDLSPLKILLGSLAGDRRAHYRRMHQALKSVLNWETTEHSLRCIRTIIFAPCMHLKDGHLAFVAERSPKLKKLMLPESDDITVEGFSKIIHNWKELEELSIGPLQHHRSDHFFRTLGNNCKNLTRLHIFGSLKILGHYFILDEDNASIIAKNLLKLKVFNIYQTCLHKLGVWTLLSKSKNLEDLNLKGCRGIVNPPISYLILTSSILYLENEISIEIKGCRSKNCLKWSVTSSAVDHKIRYTAQELVTQLWAGDVREAKTIYISICS